MIPMSGSLVSLRTVICLFERCAIFIQSLLRVKNLLHLLESCTNRKFHMLFLVKGFWFPISVVIYNTVSVRFRIILSSLYTDCGSCSFPHFPSAVINRWNALIFLLQGRISRSYITHWISFLERKQKNITILHSPTWLLLHPHAVETWFP